MRINRLRATLKSGGIALGTLVWETRGRGVVPGGLEGLGAHVAVGDRPGDEAPARDTSGCCDPGNGG